MKIWSKACSMETVWTHTRKRQRVVLNDYIEIPKEFTEAHKCVILFVDILCICGVTFLLTLSKNTRLITIRYIKDGKEASVLEAVDDAFINYNKAGFETEEFLADNEFGCLEDHLKAINIEPNFCAAQEHVPEIEKLARVVKERCRVTYHSTLHSCWHKTMTIKGAGNCVKLSDASPPLVACQTNIVLEQSSLGGPWIMTNIAKWPLVAMFRPSTKMIPQPLMRKGPWIDFFLNS